MYADRTVLADAMGARTGNILPGRAADPGVTAADSHLFVEAVPVRFRKGSPWRDLPERSGKWNGVSRRFRRRALSGVSGRVSDTLPDGSGPGYMSVDGAVAQAPGAAAVTGPMPGTGARMRWLSANSGDPATDPPIRRSSAAMAAPVSSRTLPTSVPGALVHGPVPQPRHVAEPVDGGGGQRRGPHLRERGPEGRQYPGVHPVRPPKGPGGLREIPRLPRVHDGGGEPPGAQGLRKRPVHAPRGLHDGPRGAALPEDAADPAQAVRVVGGREVPPVDVDVGCTPACVGSGDHCCHALPLLSPRWSGSETQASIQMPWDAPASAFAGDSVQGNDGMATCCGGGPPDGNPPPGERREG